MVAIWTDALPDCRPLLADPDDLVLVFRPVVELAGGAVAGFEALARFPGTAGPDVWFAAAEDAGLRAELEALAVHKALARVPDLPPGTFLTVPVSAHLLDSAPLQAGFAARPRLDGVVVELRGDADPEALNRSATVLRARGAGLAVADRTGRSVSAPDAVVLDLSTVRALGEADSAGAAAPAPRLLADDLDTPDDLTAALRCGAALGRGWVFGAPSSVLRPLASSVADVVDTLTARVRRTDAVLSLVQAVPQVPVGTADVAPAVEVDADGAPVALLVPGGPSGSTWRRPITLSVLPTEGVGRAVRLTMSRPAEHRYDPVLCTDETGRPLGLLRVADLVRATRL
jgi:hypothetical protein